MSVQIEVTLKPFKVPNFAIAEHPIRPRQEGMQESVQYSLSELSSEALAALCEQFTVGVFEKAGKQRPLK